MAKSIRVELVEGAYAVLSYVPPTDDTKYKFNWHENCDKPKIELRIVLPTWEEVGLDGIPFVRVLPAFLSGDRVFGKPLVYNWGAVGEKTGTDYSIYMGPTLKQAEDKAREDLEQIKEVLQNSVAIYKQRLSQREETIKTVLSECGEITPDD